MLEIADYREIFKQMIEHLKLNKDLSVRGFCRAAQIKSTSYLRMVLTGRRNLSVKSAHQFAKGLKLTPTEGRFFSKLVEWSHSHSETEKHRLFKELIKIKKVRKDETLILKKYEYFSHWHLPIIFVGLQSTWRKLTVRDQAKSLGISVPDLEAGLETLRKLDLIERKGGRWICKPFSLRTPREMRSLAIQNYHKQALIRAAKILDSVPADFREFGSLTLNIKKSDLQEVKRMIRKFREELSAPFAASTHGEVVYQMNVQLFPVLSIAEEPKS